MHNVQFLVNRARSKLEEEPGERGTAGASVQPEDDGVVLGVIARLEEP